MSKEKYKVCTNKECEKYNFVVKTKWQYCPSCQTRLQYPVKTRMPVSHEELRDRHPERYF